jgi:hypothetical protein
MNVEAYLLFALFDGSALSAKNGSVLYTLWAFKVWK